MRNTDQNKIQFFQVVGISFQTADVSVREQFSITAEREEAFYNALKARGLKDVMCISTCNRTEIYFFSENIHPLVNVWLEFTGGDMQTLMDAHFHHRGMKAFEHLIRVSCGLESQIPGDFEIVMQVRRSFRRAKELKLANGLFERMLNTAVHTSKQVKTQTSFSTGASSVSYATVRYLRDHLEIENAKILILGLGEIGRVTLENVLKHFHPSAVTVGNRSFDKALDFANAYDVSALPLEGALNNISEFDAVIVATGASSPVVKKEHLPANYQGVLIDLGVPANIDRSCGHITTLIDVDDLSKITKAALDSRIEMIPMVESLIELNLQEFSMWYRKRELLPLIQDMKDRLRSDLTNELNNQTLVDPTAQNTFIDNILRRFEAGLFQKIEEDVKNGTPSIPNRVLSL